MVITSNYVALTRCRSTRNENKVCYAYAKKMRICEKRESCISETLDTDLIALAFLLLRKRKKRSGNRRRILSRKVLPLLQKSTRYFCWGENTTKKNATQHVEAYSGLCKTETSDNTKTGVQFPHSLKKKSLKS